MNMILTLLKDKDHDHDRHDDDESDVNVAGIVIGVLFVLIVIVVSSVIACCCCCPCCLWFQCCKQQRLYQPERYESQPVVLPINTEQVFEQHTPRINSPNIFLTKANNEQPIQLPVLPHFV